MTATTRDRPLHREGRGPKLLAFLIGTILVGGFLALMLWQSIFVRILPGHVGVLYSLLFGGTVTQELYPEGLAVKLPWNRMYIFETRLQAEPFQILALSAEGMPIIVEATTLFRVVRDEAAGLLIDVGPDYIDRVVSPMSMSSVREVVGRYNSHELYSIDARRLQHDILNILRNTPQADLLFYQEVAIRRISLPETVVAAIQSKLAEEQQAAAYEFRLDGERLEAERRRIQAIGLRNFYSIVQSSLTDQLLTWKGIEATIEIARSPNTKVVIVGGQKDQMPLILGSDIGNIPPSTTPVGQVGGNVAPLPEWAEVPSIFDDPLSDTNRRPATAPTGSIGSGKDHKDIMGSGDDLSSDSPRSPTSELGASELPLGNSGPRPDVIPDKAPEPDASKQQ